jgi:hypothetical protein
LQVRQSQIVVTPRTKTGDYSSKTHPGCQQVRSRPGKIPALIATKASVSFFNNALAKSCSECSSLNVFLGPRRKTNKRAADWASAQIHHEQLEFGHIFNRVAQPFASQTGLLDSTIRHVINAERRHIAREQASDFKFFIGLEN